MIFEASFIAIATFILVYLRGKTATLNISLEKLPQYSIFIITSVYPLLKIVWFLVLFVLGKREIEVSKERLIIYEL